MSERDTRSSHPKQNAQGTGLAHAMELSGRRSLPCCAPPCPTCLAPCQDVPGITLSSDKLKNPKNRCLGTMLDLVFFSRRISGRSIRFHALVPGRSRLEALSVSAHALIETNTNGPDLPDQPSLPGLILGAQPRITTPREAGEHAGPGASRARGADPRRA